MRGGAWRYSIAIAYPRREWSFYWCYICKVELVLAWQSSSGDVHYLSSPFSLLCFLPALLFSSSSTSFLSFQSFLPSFFLFLLFLSILFPLYCLFIIHFDVSPPFYSSYISPFTLSFFLSFHNRYLLIFLSLFLLSSLYLPSLSLPSFPFLPFLPCPFLLPLILSLCVDHKRMSMPI